MPLRLRRPLVLWMGIPALLATGGAYMASNLVTTSSAGENLVPVVRTYTFDNTSPAISFTNAPFGWTAAQTSSVPAVDTSGDYQRTETFSSISGAYAIVNFTGSAVQWIGPKQPDGGIAQVALDTGLPVSVDTYAPSPKQFQQDLYTVTGLSYGLHHLKIEVTGTKNPASTGNVISIDAINVPS